METKEIPVKIAPVLNLLLEDLKQLFGNKLRKVVLYGSYSRGDYSDESDVDILVLLTDSGFKAQNRMASDISAKYLLNYGILFSIIIKSEDFYNNWKDTMDLFVNIEQDGIAVV